MSLLIAILLVQIARSENILKTPCYALQNAIDCLDPKKPSNILSQNLSAYEGCPTLSVFDWCVPGHLLWETAQVRCPWHNFYQKDPENWPAHTFTDFSHDQFNQTAWTTIDCIFHPTKNVGTWYNLNRTICREHIDNFEQEYCDSLPPHCNCDPLCAAAGVDNSNSSFSSVNGTHENTQIISSLQHLRMAKMIMVSGYAVSLIATTLGSILMLMLRRLRCTRIYIHINLLISFMMRAMLWILHGSVYGSADDSLSHSPALQPDPIVMQYFQDNNLSNSTDPKVIHKIAFEHLVGDLLNQRSSIDDYPILKNAHSTFCVARDPEISSAFVCRTYETLMMYFQLCNYFWFLVEGFYLKMLLQRSSVRSMSNMKYYLLFGWALPLVPILIWIIVSLITRSDKPCWIDDENGRVTEKDYTNMLILEIPIMVSVLINVFIFVSVVTIVGSKLRATLRKSDFRYRLLRANLALIPLLGIHYSLTMFVKYLATEDKTTLHTVCNYINTIMSSLQGLFVAIIYCFCNAEVQDELEKSYAAWKLGKDVRDDAIRRRSTLSNSQSGGTWWPQGRRRSSIFGTSRGQSFSVPQRRSTEQTYVPSESLLSTRPTNLGGTSTMRKAKSKLQNMLNGTDQEKTSYSGMGAAKKLSIQGQTSLEESRPISVFQTMGGIAEEDNEDPPADSESDAFISSPRRHNVFSMDSRLSRFADDSGYEDNQPPHLKIETNTSRESKPPSPPPSPI